MNSQKNHVYWKPCYFDRSLETRTHQEDKRRKLAFSVWSSLQNEDRIMNENCIMVSHFSVFYFVLNLILLEN